MGDCAASLLAMLAITILSMPHRQLTLYEKTGLWPPTWPMGLTMLRLLLLPAFLWGILIDANHSPKPHRWIAFTVFAIMAITDKLDGYLARKLNQTTKAGALLDPVADKLLIACSVIILSFDWVAPPGFAIPLWVVAAVYGKDLLVAVGAIVLLSIIGKLDIRPRPLGKISTALQLSMVLAVLLAPAPLPAWAAGWKAFVRALWWLICAVAVAASVDYVILGCRQFAQERRKWKAEIVDS
jgi:CDP-diacylglycerol--glycerol-3-phosphate 3-phosphatidyltransferase